MDNKDITYRIKALWIDDEPTNGFIDQAGRCGIDITVAETVQDGMSLLDNKSNFFYGPQNEACKVERVG